MSVIIELSARLPASPPRPAPSSKSPGGWGREGSLCNGLFYRGPEHPSENPGPQGSLVLHAEAQVSRQGTSPAYRVCCWSASARLAWNERQKLLGLQETHLMQRGSPPTCWMEFPFLPAAPGRRLTWASWASRAWPASSRASMEQILSVSWEFSALASWSCPWRPLSSSHLLRTSASEDCNLLCSSGTEEGKQEKLKGWKPRGWGGVGWGDALLAHVGH